jgi:NADH:ubiquinone oxidoreductase subunit
MNNYHAWMQQRINDKPVELSEIDAEWDKIWHEKCTDDIITVRTVSGVFQVSFPSNDKVDPKVEGKSLSPAIQKLIARLSRAS